MKVLIFTSPERLGNLRTKLGNACSVYKNKHVFYENNRPVYEVTVTKLMYMFFIPSFSDYILNEDFIICTLFSIITSILPGVNRQARHVACIGKLRNAQFLLLQNPLENVGVDGRIKR
jgi:predicted nucleic acid-binding Zn finger protein